NGPVLPRVLDAVLETGAGERGQEGDLGAEAEVHDLGALLHDPRDGGVDVVRAADLVVVRRAPVVERLGHDQLGVGRHPDHAPAVAGDGRGDAADMGAVAVVVLAVGAADLAFARITGGIHAVGVGHDLAGQVLVVE